MEEWRDIEGYEGYYQVSNKGNVKALERSVPNHTGHILLKPRILKQALNHKGYPIVYLSKEAKDKTCFVHRLVAMAFIDNPQDKPQVNHIDGNKRNNCVSNLEWCTNQENQIHAWKHGLSYVSGKAGKPKRAVLQIDIRTNEVIAEYPSIAEASAAIGHKSKSNIGECCRGHRNTVGGYRWEYKKGVV